ncbi:MAG: alanine racemase, partial [Clostridiales bacterium]|nr:alanine racemase [Clostridiales bacterium]
MISFDTPCVVLEMEKVRANIRNMQEHADRYNCKLRPHIKTHKSVALAKMQMEAGAAGITCAKTTEAEVFADGGIEDIFIAYPLVGEEKYRRALRIKKKIKRLIVAVDSIEGARMLSDFAVREGVVFEARLEADTGARRTGAVPGKLRETGAAIRELPGLNITGVYTFKSMMWKNAVTNDAEAASAEEGRLILSAAEVLRELGF